MKYFYRYLPLSDEVRSRNLFVIAGGYSVVPPNSPYPPQAHPADHDFIWRLGRTLQEYQLIYITRGTGVFESKSGGRINLGPGDMFMLFPGEWHRYSPNQSTGWDESWVAFQGGLAGQLVSEFPFTCGSPMLSVGMDVALCEEFARISAEMRQEQVDYQRIISARVLLILALATAILQRRTFGQSEIVGVIEKAKTILLEHFTEPVNIERLASDLGVGYSWFRRMFREYTGLPPAQYVLQLRLNKACELLRSTSVPIGVIGHTVGFESAYYFARIFREKMGRTPRDYRAMSQTQIDGPDTTPVWEAD